MDSPSLTAVSGMQAGPYRVRTLSGLIAFTPRIGQKFFGMEIKKLDNRFLVAFHHFTLYNENIGKFITHFPF